MSLNATVVDRIDVTPELIRLFVKADVPNSKFQPGQYVALALPGSAERPAHYPAEENVPPADKLIKRAYSIGSSPDSSGVLEFYIALLPQGALTARLASLRAGDRIFMAPKITGTFTLEGTPGESNLVFVATGTGIAPFMSMIRTPATWTAGRQITLVHGVRYESDLAYREEVLERARSASLSYFGIVSRAGNEWQGRRGHVQSLFKDGTIPLDPQRDHVFLCGNPAMIDEMETLLLSQGYREHSRKSPGNLHLEKYW